MTDMTVEQLEAALAEQKAENERLKSDRKSNDHALAVFIRDNYTGPANDFTSGDGKVLLNLQAATNRETMDGSLATDKDGKNIADWSDVGILVLRKNGTLAVKINSIPQGRWNGWCEAKTPLAKKES